MLFDVFKDIELVASERWTPQMNDFYRDGQGRWWFVTVSKGNKKREIAVSDTMLKALKRYRHSLGLSALPGAHETDYLLKKVKGHGPLNSTRQVRRIVEQCFDRAHHALLAEGLNEEAEALKHATVHWLRHTGISEDVQIRPREHVRDDAGHSTSMTTDRYIDVERGARHDSAKNKELRLKNCHCYDQFVCIKSDVERKYANGGASSLGIRSP